MRRLIKPLCFLCAAVLMLCSCTILEQKYSTANDDNYLALTQINHYLVDPDDNVHMTDSDKAYYQKLMDCVLNRESSVQLSDNHSDNEYYIDLLMQSPYYFFVSEYTLSSPIVKLRYKYSQEQQKSMLDFIDNSILDIVNNNAKKDDNDLDKLLKVYYAITQLIDYDSERTDNKELSSPLFKYPSDEVYLALKNKTSLCFGFAYTYKFAMLQLGVDCFCVYGQFKTNSQAHMWNVFKLNGKFYSCDAAWDRTADSYSKLYHFGKTDAERECDALSPVDFLDYHFAEYGDVKCTDTAFENLRGIYRFSYVEDHKFYMEGYEQKQYIYRTDTMKFE